MVSYLRYRRNSKLHFASTIGIPWRSTGSRDIEWRNIEFPEEGGERERETIRSVDSDRSSSTPTFPAQILEFYRTSLFFFFLKIKSNSCFPRRILIGENIDSYLESWVRTFLRERNNETGFLLSIIIFQYLFKDRIISSNEFIEMISQSVIQNFIILFTLSSVTKSPLFKILPEMWKKLRGTESDEYRTGCNLITYSPRSFLSHANAHYFLAHPRTLQKIKKQRYIKKIF